MRKEDIYIQRLLKKYKTADPFELCDRMNVGVYFANLGALRGMFRYNKRNTFITLNSAMDLSSEEYKFVCAHELGHLLLHKEYNRIMMDFSVYRPTRYEKEANTFAMKLLFETLHNNERYSTFKYIVENLEIDLKYESLF